MKKKLLPLALAAAAGFTHGRPELIHAPRPVKTWRQNDVWRGDGKRRKKQPR